MVDLAIWLAAALFVGIVAVCGFILGCARVGSRSGGSVSAEDREYREKAEKYWEKYWEERKRKGVPQW